MGFLLFLILFILTWAGVGILTIFLAAKFMDDAPDELDGDAINFGLVFGIFMPFVLLISICEDLTDKIAEKLNKYL